MDRIAAIRQRLQEALAPEQLDIDDESHLHRGHEGAKDGRGHFRVRIVTRAFEGVLPVKRHRMIYEAVGDLMDTDIHALAIEAKSPTEFR